jgi:hypothetical protein
MFPRMRPTRVVLIALLMLTVGLPAAAQSPQLSEQRSRADQRSSVTTGGRRSNLTVSVDQLTPPRSSLSASAAMHPAAKGAIIGGAAGAGFWGAIGVWYCTIGPHEAGECDNVGDWARGMAVYGAAGAAIGAVIGAVVGRR